MIKRAILKDLMNHLKSDQMTVLIGPRQVGKTYLMATLRKGLEEQGERTLWLSLDSDTDKKVLHSQSNFLNYINLRSGGKKLYIFIDEIQRKENAGLFLKGIYDMHMPHKFIISGSGSLELKARIPESMAGRKQLFTVSPISFTEFLHYKTNYEYEERLDMFCTIQREHALQLLKEYMSFGGYPRVILAKSIEEKSAEMQELYRSYIDRDITDLLKLEKSEALTNLLKILASQIGGIVNVSEISNTIHIEERTVSKYIWYLEQTFIIKKLTPFYRNVRKEIVKSPVYYFEDVGLRNWLLGLFGLEEIPQVISGHLFENIVFNVLREKYERTAAHLHFWRTKDQAEVDFVLETGLEVVPIEVKYSDALLIRIPKSLVSSIEKYRPERSYIINTAENHTDLPNQKVRQIHFFDFVTKKQYL